MTEKGTFLAGQGGKSRAGKVYTHLFISVVISTI